MASYPRNDWPEGYAAVLAKVLSTFPEEVIEYVTDPLTGIQRRCKFLPTVAEIVDACDRRVLEISHTKRLQNWGKNEVPLLEAPREDRPTYEELKAKYGENFGLAVTEPSSKPKFSAPSWQGIVSMYQSEPGRLQRLVKAADQYADDRGDAPA